MGRRLMKKLMRGGALLLLLAAPALGSEGIEQKIDFYLDGRVGGELVKKGNYTISFPDAEQGTLEIKAGKKAVTAPFTRQALAVEAAADRVTYRDANGGGARAIATITPRGHKFTLVLQ